jgi:hypothetical protein
LNDSRTARRGSGRNAKRLLGLGTPCFFCDSSRSFAAARNAERATASPVASLESSRYAASVRKNFSFGRF